MDGDRRHIYFRSFIDLLIDRDIYNQREWDFLLFCAKNLDKTNAQCFQDLFVLFELAQKPNGFFVEFGAADGVTISNSLLLERDHGWSGILSEPARCWQAKLRENRKAIADFRCVWSVSGQQLEFNENPIGELSTLKGFQPAHGISSVEVGTSYKVLTVSLNDLLAEHAAPPEIDYLSIDTEGSEFAILSAFDFSSHNIRIITVEHNYVTENRQAIFELLTSHGYVRVFEPFSAWDDWYVRPAGDHSGERSL